MQKNFWDPSESLSGESAVWGQYHFANRCIFRDSEHRPGAVGFLSPWSSASAGSAIRYGGRGPFTRNSFKIHRCMFFYGATQTHDKEAKLCAYIDQS